MRIFHQPAAVDVIVGDIVCGAGIVFDGIAVDHPDQADQMPLADAMLDIEMGAAFLVAIVVWVISEGIRAGSGKPAVGSAVAGTQAKTRVPVAAIADPPLQQAMAAAPQTGGEPRHPSALAGEDLDHPRYGIGSVQTGCGSAQNFDAFDLVERHAFQRRGARCRRAHSQSVDQHQRVAAVAAADANRGVGSSSALLGDFQPGLGLEQLHERRLARGGDLALADHGDIADDRANALGYAGRRDNDGFSDKFRQAFRMGGSNKDGAQGERKHELTHHEFQLSARVPAGALNDPLPF
jgi:hypothetical protein